MRHRSDGSINILYEHPNDLIKEGIKVKKVQFYSGKYLLTGYTYCLDTNLKHDGLILIYHGLGYGHAYLLNLIRRFVRANYVVFAYDQHGAALSEGPVVGDMTSSLKDAKNALDYIKATPYLNELPLYVFGHSWGGYTALNSLNFKEFNIKKVISVAGFDNEYWLARGYNPFFSLFLWPRLIFKHGKYAFFSAKKAFKKSDAKILYIQGEDDKIVLPKYAGYRFKKISSKRSNVEVLLLPNKGHTPFISNEAQRRQNELYEKLGIISSRSGDYNLLYDYTLCSECDDVIVAQMIDFFKD